MYSALVVAQALAGDVSLPATPAPEWLVKHDIRLVPGSELARIGLAWGWTGIPLSAVNFPLVSQFTNGDTFGLAFIPAAIMGGGSLLFGPIATSFGQKRTLNELDLHGLHVPRTAKRVGDALYIAGAATTVVFGIWLSVSPYASAPQVGTIVGGGLLATSLIPYQIQQSMIRRAVRGPSAHVIVTPTGLMGVF